MNSRFGSFFRANPDIIAIALLLAVMLSLPTLAKPRLQLTFASDPQTERVLVQLQERGEAVWQRLESRMRSLEQKFDKLSVPRSRGASCSDSESD